MNRKALITTTLALLGSASSIAMAHPTTRDSQSAGVSAHVTWDVGAPVRTYPAPIIVRDHRSVTVEPRYREDSRWGWGREPHGRLLAEGFVYSAGEYRKDIVLEGRGRFNALQLTGEQGRSFIKEVRIEYIGGSVQSIPLNRTLRAGESMTLDLYRDRAINRIFVYRADGNNMNIGFRSGEFSVVGL
jgi:hypothetical protein